MLGISCMRFLVSGSYNSGLMLTVSMIIFRVRPIVVQTHVSRCSKRNRGRDGGINGWRGNDGWKRKDGKDDKEMLERVDLNLNLSHKVMP